MAETPTPTSSLYLCKNIELDPNYNYTLDFENITQQLLYFNGKIASEFDINTGYSFIRDTQKLKVQANIDDLLGINYLFYNNGNKRYYAFITKKEYINPTCTSLSFKIDVLQSFMFEYELNECFIEREHQDRYINDNNTLKPVFNTQSEDLATGEYVYDKKYEVIDNRMPDNIKYVIWAIVVAKSALTSNDTHSSVDGISTGTYVYIYPVQIVLNDGTRIGDTYIRLNNQRVPVGLISNAIELNSNVISIEYTPYLPLNYEIGLNGSLYDFTITYNSKYGYSYKLYHTINSIGFYLAHIYIRDSSILSRDYLYNTGNDNDTELKGEHNIADLSINNLANINFEPKVLLYPYTKNRLCCFDNERIANILEYKITGVNFTTLFDTNYSGIINDIGEEHFTETKSLLLSKSNEINLGTDRWLDYQMNNKATLKSGLLTNVGTTAGLTAFGIATGGIGLAVAGSTAISTLGNIANEMIRREDIKQAPNDIRKSDGNFIVNNIKYHNLITLERYRAKFINNIYNYFKHFGYKCREIKKPNLKSRYYYNYIKTIGANIKTNIDAEFKTEIERAFDNGLTIWHFRSAGTFKGINIYDYENVENILVPNGNINNEL